MSVALIPSKVTGTIHQHNDPFSTTHATLVQVGGSQAIQFICRKNEDKKSATDAKISELILGGNAGQLLNHDPKCLPWQHLDECANLFSLLSECSCSAFNRKDSPLVRQAYENEVLDKVRTIVEKQFEPFELNIAIRNPGGLFGELTLMVRVFELLKNVNGKIRLSLIDDVYQSQAETYQKIDKERTELQKKCHALMQQRLNLCKHMAVCQNHNHTHQMQHLNAQICGIGKEMKKLAPWESNFEGPLGKSVAAFTHLLTKQLTPNLNLEINLFGGDTAYKAFCAQSTYRNHLMLGSDVGADADKIEDLAKYTQIDGGTTIILFKTDDTSPFLQTVSKVSSTVASLSHLLGITT